MTQVWECRILLDIHESVHLQPISETDLLMSTKYEAELFENQWLRPIWILLNTANEILTLHLILIHGRSQEAFLSR